jgi:hypothetical protein
VGTSALPSLGNTNVLLQALPFFGNLANATHLQL